MIRAAAWKRETDLDEMDAREARAWISGPGVGCRTVAMRQLSNPANANNRPEAEVAGVDLNTESRHSRLWRADGVFRCRRHLSVQAEGPPVPTS